MALDTIIFPQTQFGNLGYDNYQLLQDNYDHIFGGFSDHAYNFGDLWDPKSSPDDCSGGDNFDMNMEITPTAAVMAVGRRKRRRGKSGKNKEELENQRMTHITVERNRRKQMNEYLAVIRSLMPSSYVQRGDQASIVGGAINFVKELEQQLQTLEVQKRATINNNAYSPSSPPMPFGHFFAFPQYSSHGTSDANNRRLPPMAEIEVTLVESQSNIKILSKKRHSQLLKMVAGLQVLWLTILHLNVTTFEDMVLYTLSVKLEDRCQLSTIDDIADAVNCLLFKIDQQGSLCTI
ncbi:hypothetical protein QVD17_01225 [Tagetes erecta]|uniref:BHLH domain-containing protein n=1 Tax=Tagetes erecta TaxID=13708 RepID=A0AAD8LBR1_TARER|nr:hypothetical protein QVD17_01225 [Tagetes erecta]